MPSLFSLSQVTGRSEKFSSFFAAKGGLWRFCHKEPALAVACGRLFLVVCSWQNQADCRQERGLKAKGGARLATPKLSGMGLHGPAFVPFKLKGSYRTTAQKTKAKSSRNKQGNKQHKRLKILFRPNGKAGTSSWAVWAKRKPPTTTQYRQYGCSLDQIYQSL